MQSSLFSHLTNTKQVSPARPESAAHDQKYVVRDKRQVIDKLNAIKNKQSLITVQDSKNRYSFQTIIIKVENNLICLDLPAKDDVLKKILDQGCIDLYCNFQGVKVRFTAKKPKLHKVKAEHFLTVSIPESIFWKEDRDTHRVKVPISHQKTYLAMTLKDSQQTHNDIKFQIHDLSSQGISFINHDSSISKLLKEDAELVGQLFTANSPTIHLTLTVRHRARKLNNGHQADLIGCHFSKIDHTSESRIQYYIQTIETRHLSIN